MEDIEKAKEIIREYNLAHVDYEEDGKKIKEIVLEYNIALMDYMKFMLSKFDYRITTWGAGRVVARTKNHEVIIDNLVTMHRIDRQEISDEEMEYFGRLAGEMYGFKIHDAGHWHDHNFTYKLRI